MRYIFLPPNDNHGRVTVCVEEQQNAGDFSDGGVRFSAGITYCTPKDQFCRAVGKAKALGRLRQGLHEGILHPRENSKHFFNVIVPYYDAQAQWPAEDRPAHVRFAEALAAHIESFVPAAVAKEQTPTPNTELG